jgi:lysophospholipase L1-like esterase
MTVKFMLAARLMVFLMLAAKTAVAAQTELPALQWIDVTDARLRWLNVADWETRGDGLQPVRVTKEWRDKWPARTASRAQSAAGVTAYLRTDSKRLALRVTFVEVPDGPGTPEAIWERSRPSYFDVYKNGKYLASVAAATKYSQQDVPLYDSPQSSGPAEFAVLFPFYYRNAEVIVHGVGIDADANLSAAARDPRPRVLFHGDSITHGHGATSPRATYVWQSCEKASCTALNFGFGGTAWADNVVAQTIAVRNDWDVLVLALGTNSFGGADSAGKSETAAQYGQKYDAFLSTIRTAAPTKPILAVTPILNRFDLTLTRNPNGELPKDYRDAIADIVKRRQRTDKNLHFLSGLGLVNDPIDLWVTDLVHPNDAGAQRMANGVAAALKPILAARRR